MPMKARYTTVNGEVIAQKRDGVRRQFLPDPLGSTVAMLDNTQTITDTFSYWPYGEVASRTGTTETPFQYIGTLGYYQDAPGRSYVRARYLDSTAGRWITQDPIGLDFGANLFSYGSRSPVSFVDPAGLRVITHQDLVTLGKLYGHFSDNEVIPIKTINAAVVAIKHQIIAVKQGQPDPPNLRALLWAISNLGVTDYGADFGTVSGHLSPVGPGKNKCNVFVANAYGIGAGVGFNDTSPAGYPVHVHYAGRFGPFHGIRRVFPPVANDLANRGLTEPNLAIATAAVPGDIVAFLAKNKSDSGHATLKVGPDLLIYASNLYVKLGTFNHVLNDPQNPHSGYVIRKYGP